MFSRAYFVMACVVALTLEVRAQEVQTPSAASLTVQREPDRLVGGVTDLVVGPRDTLRAISARFGLDVTTLARENGMRVDGRLAAGQILRIDNRHVVPAAIDLAELVVNIPQRMLYHRGGDSSMVGYPIAVGRPSWPTPTGDFTVTVLERHPTWEVPRSILEESRRAGRIQPPVVPPGPNNPLGDFWMGLSLAGIGIHATNAPASIFRTASHGCIRVHPDDIAQLFDRVEVGSSGRIIYEPVLLAFVGEDVYLEVHRDVYRRVAKPQNVARTLAAAAGLSELIDWAAADAVAAAADGVARSVTASVPPAAQRTTPRVFPHVAEDFHH
ncbi:MAG: L,D-transpeptidase family protein [Vicinamibacterales bacterium]